MVGVLQFTCAGLTLRPVCTTSDKSSHSYDEQPRSVIDEDCSAYVAEEATAPYDCYRDVRYHLFAKVFKPLPNATESQGKYLAWLAKQRDKR